jgi:hypothetical protein
VRSNPLSSYYLKDICEAHQGKVSDKWDSYVQIYDELFQNKRNSIESILEIGIQNGGSLEIWSAYFPFAEKIYGLDIDPKCELLIFEDDRIKVFVGDANTSEVLNDVTTNNALFDIIIDDGSHVSSDIIRSFSLYFPKLKPGGTYVIEDLHASYWDSHEGALNYAFSSIEFLKKLVDIVNFSHWGASKLTTDILESFVSKYNLGFVPEDLLSIQSVYFQDSICVISKALTDENPLGVRRIFGKDASIENSVNLFNNQLSESPSQEKNLLFNVSPEDSLILDLGKKNAQLSTKIDDIESELQSIKSSASWRYTVMLRHIKYLFAKIYKKK